MGNFGSPWPIERLPARYQEQAARQLHPGAFAPATPPPAATTHTHVRKRRKQKPAADPVDSTQGAQFEPTAQHAPHDPAPPEALYSTRVLVRVESRRCGVQCDPDNIVVKWHIDALRYARILRDDTSGAIDLKVTETRVPTRKEEGVLITIEPIPEPTPCTHTNS